MCFYGLMGAVMTEIKYSCSNSQRRSCLLFSACTLKSDLVSLLKYLVCVVLTPAKYLAYYTLVTSWNPNHLSVVLLQTQFKSWKGISKWVLWLNLQCHDLIMSHLRQDAHKTDAPQTLISVRFYWSWSRRAKMDHPHTCCQSLNMSHSEKWNTEMFFLSEEKMTAVKAAEKGMALMAFKRKQAPLKPACILMCFSSSGWGEW